MGQVCAQLVGAVSPLPPGKASEGSGEAGAGCGPCSPDLTPAGTSSHKSNSVGLTCRGSDSGLLQGWVPLIEPGEWAQGAADEGRARGRGVGVWMELG